MSGRNLQMNQTSHFTTTDLRILVCAAILDIVDAQNAC